MTTATVSSGDQLVIPARIGAEYRLKTGSRVKVHCCPGIFEKIVPPHKEFQKCVARYRGDANPRGFSCWDQYLAMAFAQLTCRENLREIQACLGAMRSKLYRMGFRGSVVQRRGKCTK